MKKRIIPLLFVATVLMLTGCGKKTDSQQGGDPGTTSSQPATQEVTVELAGALGEEKTSTDTVNGAHIDETVQGLHVVFDGAYKVFTDGYNIRVYKNKTLTLSATKITKVELVCTAAGTEKYGPGNFTADVGTYTYSERNGSWTGDAANIVFTAAQQVRASSMKVTFIP